MKRILTITLALAMLLALTVPTFASEGADIPPETETITETEPVPEGPELSDIPETPAIPETSENPYVPESPETPEVPEIPEIPDETETSEDPEQPASEEQDPMEAAVNDLPEELPIISVSVPSNCRVIINPYQLEVELDGETHTEQIVSETCAMTNFSEWPVSVSVRASGVAYGQDMIFVTTPPAEETHWKELFVYVEFLNELSGGAWSGQYIGAANQIAVIPEPYEHLNVLELASGETGFYRMFGAASTHPEIPWDAGDDFLVTLTFTFTLLPAKSEEFLEASEIPWWPEAAEAPGIPEASETPEVSEMPEVPEMPGVWEVPTEPEFSEDPAGVQEETAGTDETEWEEGLF